jgi:N-acylglucosamine-6-phosphate 2-epimerase
MTARLGELASGLVVSCQAPPGHPLRTSATIARLARCAVLGGARAVRVNHADDVRAVRATGVDVPVIGLHKVKVDRYRITTSFRHAAALVDAGADVVAVEVTNQAGLGRCTDLVKRVRRELGVSVLADVSNTFEGEHAWSAGADLVATTLSGYTPDSPPSSAPDFTLVEHLTGLGIRTVAEGRYRTPDDVRRAFAAGAYATVVGGAITDPVAITATFADAARDR